MITKRHIALDVHTNAGRTGDETAFVTIISNNRVARVPVSGIETVEQEGRKLHIETAGESYECYSNIEMVVPILGGRSFYRPMKSLIINLDQIQEMNDGEIVMRSGTVLMIGRNSYSLCKQAFKRYLLRYPPFERCIRGSLVNENSQLPHTELASGNLNEKYKIK